MINLHLGCGPRIIDGWLNLDANPVDERIDFIDVTNPWPFDVGSVMLIYSEDLFEHLSQKEQIHYLRESYRVLHREGVGRIVCPDLTYCLCEMEDTWAWGHKLVPNDYYLGEVFECLSLGYNFNSRNQSICSDMPKDHRPHAPRLDEGHLFVDYWVADEMRRAWEE